MEETYMTYPLISIVTVCYNAEREIGPTIQSVLKQNYINIEYIIVDGASTDRTLENIETFRSDFKQKNIPFTLISEPDKGIYDAMNKGCRRAHGEWINFMNAGDRFTHADVLKNVFSHPIENNITVIYGNTLCQKSFGTVLMHPKPMEKIQNGMIFCHQSAFVRTKTMQEHPFDISYTITADFKFFWERHLAHDKFLYLNTDISCFEAEKGKSSKQRLKVLEEYGHIMDIDKTMCWKLKVWWKKNILAWKAYTRKAVPQKWTNIIRKQNYRRIANKRK